MSKLLIAATDYIFKPKNKKEHPQEAVLFVASARFYRCLTVNYIDKRPIYDKQLIMLLLPTCTSCASADTAASSSSSSSSGPVRTAPHTFSFLNKLHLQVTTDLDLNFPFPKTNPLLATLAEKAPRLDCLNLLQTRKKDEDSSVRYLFDLKKLQSLRTLKMRGLKPQTLLFLQFLPPTLIELELNNFVMHHIPFDDLIVAIAVNAPRLRKLVLGLLFTEEKISESRVVFDPMASRGSSLSCLENLVELELFYLIPSVDHLFCRTPAELEATQTKQNLTRDLFPPNLVRLRVAGCEQRGSLDFALLPRKLEVLDAFTNNFTSLVNIDQSPPNLLRLDLSNCRDLKNNALWDEGFLGKMPRSISVLKLHGCGARNAVTATPLTKPALLHRSSLHTLDIGYMHIRTFDPAWLPETLRILNAPVNEFNKPSFAFRDLPPHLEYLCLRGCKLDGDIEDAEFPPLLRCIDLSENRLKERANFRSLPNLRRLHLEHNHFDGLFIENCPALRVLDIHGNSEMTQCPDMTMFSDSLRAIRFSHCKNMEGVLDLRKLPKNLKYILGHDCMLELSVVVEGNGIRPKLFTMSLESLPTRIRNIDLRNNEFNPGTLVIPDLPPSLHSLLLTGNPNLKLRQSDTTTNRLKRLTADCLKVSKGAPRRRSRADEDTNSSSDHDDVDEVLCLLCNGDRELGLNSIRNRIGFHTTCDSSDDDDYFDTSLRPSRIPSAYVFDKRNDETDYFANDD